MTEWMGPAALAFVSAFGPAGAAFALAAGVLGYFYRRDHLVKQKGLVEAHARRDAREERLIAVIETNAIACERAAAASATLSAGIERLAQAVHDIQERQTRDFADVLREFRR